MKDRQQNIRKAAILVASLDQDSADMLLGQMSMDQAATVREAIDELGPIDPEEQNEVIEEFFRIGPLVPEKQPAGIELDIRSTRHLKRPQREVEPPVYTSRETPLRQNTPPFRFLHESSPSVLAPLLQREHPQTVAVVVSHLPPERAARVLGALPPALQAEVARRLIDLEQADPEILREVERGLETWLSEQARSVERRSAGMTALNNILAAADREVTQDIIDNLRVHDRQLASRLAPATKRPTFVQEPQPAAMTFADVAELDDASLALVLRTAASEIVLLALAGAPATFVERVTRRLPPREARILRHSLDNMGPTRLSDMEEAQRQLADIASQLEETGQLGRRNRGLSLAA